MVQQSRNRWRTRRQQKEEQLAESETASMPATPGTTDFTACVVACSGPSLATCDPYSLGLPVIAVSTAIRNERLLAPDVWVFADRPNSNHGSGKDKVLLNPAVLKVVPQWVPVPRRSNNLLRIPYVKSKMVERAMLKQGRTYMDGLCPILRDTHKSVTLALGWLSTQGAKTIYICGCDLATGRKPSQKYGYHVKPGDRNLNGMIKSLGTTGASLQRYAASAKLAGIRLVAWNSGPRLERILGKEIPDVSATDADPRSEDGAAAPVRADQGQDAG